MLISASRRRRRRGRPLWLLIGLLVVLMGAVLAVNAVRGGSEDPDRPAGPVAEIPADTTTSGRDHEPSETPTTGSTGEADPATLLPEGSPHSARARRAMARIARGSEPIRNAGGRQRLVALTFDDGPGPWTGQVLDTLKRLDVRATFYVQGTLVEGSEELLRRIVAEGHEIGVHGWAHADLTAADDAKVRHEVGDTRDAIRRFAGVDPLTMRPPYGAVDNRVRRLMAPYRLPIVLWDVDTRDWDGRTARTIRDETIASTSAGSIVLMHDGGSDRATTLAAVAPIVRALRAKRVEFVTVSELLMRDRAGGASGEGAGTPAGGAAGEADPTTGPAPDPASAGEEPAPGG